MVMWWLLLLLASVSCYQRSRICPSADIRNKPNNLEALRGCHVVEGHVQIVLMERGNETDFLRHALPELREITDYLLVYHVVGLRSVGHILPNLTMIRGRNLFEDYALVVYEMTNLQEVGLTSLTDIVRGAVRIEKNPRLCYVQTVNWDRIAPWDPLKNYIIHNKDLEICPSCPPGCPQGLCWSHNICQTVPNAESKCHHLCAGGCLGTTASDCVICRKYLTNTNQCVHHCPSGTYEYLGRRCVSEAECTSLIEPETQYQLVVYNGTCTADCPAGQKHGVRGCVPCHGGHCHKICPGHAIDTIASAQYLRGCTFIDGPLEISIKIGKPMIVAQELEENLGAIEEIKGCLKIIRSPPLINLHFLKNLTVIHGDESIGNCAIFVMENQNLQELWDWESKKDFKILKNRLFFHYNSKLCLNHIRSLLNITHQKNVTNIEVSKESNGDKFPCNAHKIIVSIINKTYNLIQIHIPLVQISLQYSFLRYEIHYTKDPSRNISRYDDLDQCSDYSWRTKDVYVDIYDSVTTHGINVSFTELEPNMQYAYYVTTYTADQIVGTSDMQYEKTLPTTPSELVSVQAYAPSSKEIVVSWLPPRFINGDLEKFVITWKLLDQDESITKLRDYCEYPMTYLDFISTKSNVEQKLQNRTSCCIEVQKALPKNKFEGLCINLKKCVFPKGFPKSKPSPSYESYINRYIYLGGYSSKTEKDLRISTLEKKATNVSTSSKDDKMRRNKMKFVSLPPASNKFTIHNVKHFRDYIITVKACRKQHSEETNSLDKTRCSKTDILFVRTQKDEKADMISTNIHVEVNNRTLLVYWDTPSDPNGLIVSFEVEYRQRDVLNPKSIKYCIPYLEYTSNKNSFRVPNLLPGNYELRIRSVSYAGKSVFTHFIPFIVTKMEMSLSEHLLVTSIILLVSIVVIIIIGLLTSCLKKRVDLDHILSASVNPEYYCPKDQWELKRDDIVLVKELGHGTFGKVYEGLVKPHNIPCAIKVVSESFNLYDRNLFLNEASIMKSVSKTYHIVQLIGVITCEKPPLVVMELMSLGDLRSYLISVRDTTPPSQCTKLFMAAQIADGMCFMEAKKFVHRDLAARNCLLSDNLTVKVGDFGMTRDIYETDYYRKGDKGLLPIRWMAPESLKDGLFTSQSDVWSYGVVLWEIVMMGRQPYHGISNEVVLKEVMAGQLRLDIPIHCPPPLRTLMMSCWRSTPTQRIQFMQIVGSLEYYVDGQFKEMSYYYSEEAVRLRKDISESEEMCLAEDPLLGSGITEISISKRAFLSRPPQSKFTLKLNPVPEDSNSSADDT